MLTEYGLAGELTSLVSERDQNFGVKTTDGRRYVFKIANRSESHVTTDFQIKALLHIERQRYSFATPVIYRTVRGDTSAQMVDGDVLHVCRVVSYLPGALLSTVDPSPRLAGNFGQRAAELDIALAEFEHAGESQVLLWDLQRANQLRELLQYLGDTALRTAVGRCLDDFDVRVKPALPTLRRQVIHADLHGENVLVNAEDHDLIAGVFDFGDMIRAPLIMEVAIAAAYLRVIEGDALLLIAPFVSGFNEVIALREVEIGLLFDLVRARLAATISILRWRATTRGSDDEYSRDNLHGQRAAETFLARLDVLGRDAFTQVIRSACES